MQNDGNRFMFSVIIPVYNVEQFLCDAIDSIISQSIGFDENIQLILVNDGSPDNSGDICRDYQRNYSDNIVYVEKENGGVSSARNAGLGYVKGRFVNFLDGDDWWNSEAFECAERFFAEHPDVSIVTGRLVMSGRSAGRKHHLDYKYRESGVVDIYDNYKMPEMSCSKSFIRAELLKDVRFDESVSVSEDLLLINTLILKEGKYGIVKDAEYYYRRRDDESSAIDSSSASKSWYTVTPKKVFKKIIEQSKQEKGEVIPYIQYLLATDLQWRLNKQLPDFLTDEEKQEYLEDIREVLKNIEDRIILEQRNMMFPRKVYALKLKYGEDSFAKNDLVRREAAESSALRLRVDDVSADSEIVIKGRADEKYIGDEYHVFAEDDKGNIFPAEYEPDSEHDISGLDPDLKMHGQNHILRLPLEEHGRYSFFIADGKGWEAPVRIRRGNLAGDASGENVLLAAGKFVIKQMKDKTAIEVVPAAGKKKNTRKNRFSMDILTIGDMIEIRGVAHEKYISEDAVVVAKDRRGKEYPAVYSACPVYDVTDEDTQTENKGYSHSFRLPLKDHAVYSFVLKDGAGREKKLKVQTGKFSRLSNIEDSFIRTGDYIIKLRDDCLCVYDYHLRSYLASSFRYNKALKQNASPEILRLRKKGLREKRRHSKPVWLISDRTDTANDNGEALFTYLMDSEYKDKYDIYFVIERTSPDYDRMRAVGKVIEYGSEEHLVKQIAASAVISSAGEAWVANPYGKDQKYLRDILDYKFVFLQHGITKDDLSGWLHLYKKNIGMFVTAANAEYDSIVNGNYGYDESVVKLTGFARFDRLTSAPEKTVAIMPTWRNDIAGALIPGTSKRAYSDTFRDTDYFRFYDRLIHDERLNEALEKTGYKGIFYMHPLFKKQAVDFDDAPNITVWRDEIEYSRVFRESSLMVTDYSSVAMDFAYLKKPVIYTHFDREHFFKSHSYTEGYFSYEQDGFGPVLYDLDSTVSEIIKALEEDCREPEQYVERVDRFFAYTDRNNCRRIAEEIESITGLNKKDEKRFLFSVIVPVYNAEQNLAEAIDSVTGQTVGFKENIQLILVNDGSRDGSAEICRRYRDKYPDNIVFIDKPNGGVSSARNEGLRHAKGEFIGFLDSDDIWEEHAFERYRDFFEEHPDVNFAAARLELFGRRSGFIHHLDYEFRKTRVIDIEKVYDHPQFRAASSVFRASAIKGLWFDESLAIAEDMLFLNTMILRDGRFGVIREAVYRYRRADNSESLIDSQWKKRAFYFDVYEKVHRKLIDMSVRKYGKVIPYLQYMLVTDFRFRITRPHEEVLSEQDLKTYLQNVKEILLLIDDDILLENRGLILIRKIDALRAKYGDAAFESNEELKEKLAGKVRMTIGETDENGPEMVLGGTANEKCIDKDWSIFAEDETGRRYESEYMETEPYVRRFSQGTLDRYVRKTVLPLEDTHTYRFRLSTGTDPLRITFGTDSKLSAKENTQWVTDSSIVTASKDMISVKKITEEQEQIHE